MSRLLDVRSSSAPGLPVLGTTMAKLLYVAVHPRACPCVFVRLVNMCLSTGKAVERRDFCVNKINLRSGPLTLWLFSCCLDRLQGCVRYHLLYVIHFLIWHPLSSLHMLTLEIISKTKMSKLTLLTTLPHGCVKKKFI